MAVRQMAPVRQVHAQNRVAGLEHGQIDRHVSLTTRMRLHIDVFGAEQFFGALDGKGFDDVDEFATAVIAPPRISLGVFVRKHGSRGCEHGFVGKILRGDHFETCFLPPCLVLDRCIYLGIDFFEGLINAVHRASYRWWVKSLPRRLLVQKQHCTTCYNPAQCLA